MSGQEITIGRLLRAGTAGFVAGCQVRQLGQPYFGALVRAPLGAREAVYGLIYDMRIEDDGLVRQLALAEQVAEDVIRDNRAHRNVPVEISVLAVGYRRGEAIVHLLPPRPPLSLDRIVLCDDAELVAFTASGRLGYFRHVLRAQNLPVEDLLATHIRQAQLAHQRHPQGQTDWGRRAVHRLVTLLRDDYEQLVRVLDALSDALPSGWIVEEVNHGSAA